VGKILRKVKWKLGSEKAISKTPRKTKGCWKRERERGQRRKRDAQLLAERRGVFKRTTVAAEEKNEGKNCRIGGFWAQKTGGNWVWGVRARREEDGVGGGLKTPAEKNTRGRRIS